MRTLRWKTDRELGAMLSMRKKHLVARLPARGLVREFQIDVNVPPSAAMRFVQIYDVTIRIGRTLVLHELLADVVGRPRTFHPPVVLVGPLVVRIEPTLSSEALSADLAWLRSELRSARPRTILLDARIA